MFFRIVVSLRMTYPRSKHVAFIDTQTLLPNCSCVLTDTNFVYDTIMTQQDVTYKDRDLSSRGNLAMPQAGLSPPRLGHHPSPVRVGSVASEVALRHNFSKQAYFGFTL